MKYFTDSEFECPCCGQNWFDIETSNMLDEARDIAKIPFKLNSACRCFKHNSEVGGSNTSSHLIENEFGERKIATAVDISCTSSSARAKIMKALIQVGFTRIGIAKTFIHCDTDKDKSPNVFWLY